MKHNLAKVLGLEEYNQEPNIRVEPTEDEVIQIQQDKFEQEMSDHQETTTEALEAIGNAQALASVIARNDSQDKTAYELLKVAVEQLKEKTGVKTQSVSLESIDKTSYKTEALEDVKKFISKVWEAIKKAFFAMVHKVKDFFKGVFSKSKKLEKEAEEVVDMTDEFIKKYNKKAGGNKGDAPNVFSDEVYEYLGREKPMFSRGHSVTLSSWDESGVLSSIGLAISNVTIHYADIDRDGNLKTTNVLEDKVLRAGKFELGVYSYEVSIKDGKAHLKFFKSKDAQDVKNLENIDANKIRSDLLKQIKSYIKEIEDIDNQIEKDLDGIKTLIWVNERVYKEYSPEELDRNKEKIKEVRESMNRALQNGQASAVAYAALSSFMYKKAKAAITYAKESIRNLESIQGPREILGEEIDQVGKSIK